MPVSGDSARFVADYVLPCDEIGSLFVPGVIDVEAGRITWVGPQDGAPDSTQRIERVDGLLMPGLINTHCHSPMTLFRGAGEGLGLDRWLQEVIWPRESRLEEEDVYWGMTLACAEMLKGGVTTSAEMYFFFDAVARAVDDAGFRSLITPGIIVAPGWESLGTWERQLDQLCEFHDRVDGSGGGRLRTGFGPHSLYAVPVDAAIETAVRARDRGALVHLHVAETRHEAAEVEAAYGMSVPRILAESGVLDADVLAAHGVWMSDEDLAICRDHRVAIAHCPQSNAKLGSGVARVKEMMDLGIKVSLGSDGPASNNNLDLWEEIRLTPLLARATRLDAGILGAFDVMSMATRHGADALRWPDIGVLESGRWADMIRVDMDDEAFVPVVEPSDVVSHLVWSSSARHVRDVWVAGRHVVVDGRCVTVDVNEAKRQVHSRARRLAIA